MRKHRRNKKLLETVYIDPGFDFVNTLKKRGGSFPTHGTLAQALSLTMRSTRTANPLCFPHHSDQKPGYRQVPVRIFWSVLRYVFKNSARYILLIIFKDQFADK